MRARAASERLVASVRLGIMMLLSGSSIVLGLISQEVSWSSIPALLAPVGYALLLFAVPQRSNAVWVPWVVSAVDVTFATGCLALFVVFDAPLSALNNRVTFETYFVAVTIAALRFDWRLCLFTAALAIAQYLGLFAYCALHWDLKSLASPTHGSFTWLQFANRVLVLAAHGAATMAIAQWARHLRLMIGTDQLTGLLQRRPFLERIEEELGRADLARTSLSIAIFDVDDFKTFNDHFGHLEGDRALVRIAEQLRLGVRTTDLVARYGGEEFVVAFPRLEVQLAIRRAEALRESVASDGESSGGRLTISAGVASWPIDGPDFETVLRRADERLYAAKSAGKNLVLGPRPTPLRSPAGTAES